MRRQRRAGRTRQRDRASALRKPSNNGNHQNQRQSVLDAAARIFSERGYAGAGLGDVAKALGISRPALYYYFTSKQDILSSLIDEISIAGKDAVVEICSQQTDPVTTLRNLIQTLLLFVMHHKHAYRVVVQEEAEFAPETQRLHRAAKRTVLRGFRKAVADGMEAGHFRRLDPEVAALGLIGICNWCAFWFRPDGRMTDIEVAEQLTQMAMASLLGPQDAESTKRDFATVLQSMESAIGNVNALRHKILNR